MQMKKKGELNAMESLYAEQLTAMFIEQELKGFLVKREWNLLDIVAVKAVYDQKFRHDLSEIHVFEVKSSRDNVYKIFDQLPCYIWIADFVWLILGQKQKVPKHLPKWVGVIKFNGETFDRTYIPSDRTYGINQEFRTIKQIYLANYGLPADGKLDKMAYSSSWRFLVDFIKKWFINSVFGTKKKKIIPYNKIEQGLLYYLKRVDSIRDVYYEEKNGVFHPKHIDITEAQLEKAMRCSTLDEFAVNRR